MAVIGTCVVIGCMALGAPASTGSGLKLLGGHAGAAAESCGVALDWTYYLNGGIVRFVGHTNRRVGSVKLVIWRCYATRFRIVEMLPPVHVNSAGAFKGSFAVNARSYCFAQASAAGWHSNRVYFRVR